MSFVLSGGADGPRAAYLADSPLLGGSLGFGGSMAVLVAVCLAAYFIGNISPSTIMARRRGIDIKAEGSGNAGTTNALRLMGKKAGAITLIVDVLKGGLAVLLGMIFAGEMGGMCCALMVFLGHVWPIVYRFRGGKGAAAAFGGLLALYPLIALIDICVVIAAVLISKRMSVGSIAGSVIFPFLVFFMEPFFTPIAAVIAVILIFGHRANISRLIHGEEPVMSIFERKDDKEDGDGEGRR